MLNLPFNGGMAEIGEQIVGFTVERAHPFLRQIVLTDCHPRYPFWMKLFTLSLTIASAFLFAGQVVVAQTPTFNRNASVHDPSVIKVGDRFYVYGSHGASAWTEDLMNWTQVAQSVTAGNPPHFQNIWTELSDLKEWTNADTLWAADVYQLEDGKYYYYYNVWTDYQSYRSYMGVAVSDDIEGPYKHKDVILKGGTGISGFNPLIHPNTIDPTLYRDTEDNLWMVYGSYSGGIYVLEMDDTTGLQKPDQSWGTKILTNGNGPVTEGPFMDYNEETGYFYLFMSYGGLAAADDYNMRVFRSENPNGPFLDPSGKDAVDANPTTWKDFGLALAGGWQFQAVEGEPNQSPAGYLSPGHNSVIKDPATGKWFNFFHTRFVGRGEAHEVRIHQFFFNEDGWPVMAPHRYAGETQGTYTAEEVAGSYKALIHNKEIIREAIPTYSSVIGLQQGGGLVGADGSWSMVDGKNIRITIDGELYKGVVCEQWDNENKLWVTAFTAASSNGLSLWGSEVAVRDREEELTPPEIEAIDDIILPADESLSVVLNNLNPDPNLSLQYQILEGPDGMSINPSTATVSWEPYPSQRGKVFKTRIQVYDLLEPELADEVEFWIYASGGFELEEQEITFETAAATGILDGAGVATGLSARLSGTGASITGNDSNLLVDTDAAVLHLDSTESDFNQSGGLGILSAIGLNLSDLGFTGEQDFTAIAEFGPVEGFENIDQVGLFVGSSATTLTRAGIIYEGTSARGLAVHTQSGSDEGAVFDASGYDVSDGVTVAITREAGQWSYSVDGISIAPTTPNASFLDAATDLTVGVFAINPLNSNSKTVEVKSLKVAVLTDQPKQVGIEVWRTENFGESPAAGIAGNEDDPDGDGRKNLIEYALGTNPLLADQDPEAAIFVEDGKLYWSFNRIADPVLIYRVYANDQPVLEGAEEIWTSTFGDNLSGPALIEVDIGDEADAKVFLQLAVEVYE